MEPEQHFEILKVGRRKVLRLRVGLVWPKGQSPKNIPGMIRYNGKPGKKWDKAYLEPTGADPFEGIGYSVPEYGASAPWGELLLGDRPDSATVFGRFGEDSPFTFERQSRYISLRVYREEEYPFQTLYAKVWVDGEVYYLAIAALWKGDSIALLSKEVASDEVPAFLADASNPGDPLGRFVG